MSEKSKTDPRMSRRKTDSKEFFLFLFNKNNWVHHLLWIRSQYITDLYLHTVPNHYCWSKNSILAKTYIFMIFDPKLTENFELARKIDFAPIFFNFNFGSKSRFLAWKLYFLTLFFEKMIQDFFYNFGAKIQMFCQIWNFGQKYDF